LGIAAAFWRKYATMVITYKIEIILASIVLLDLVFFADTDMDRVANAKVLREAKILGWRYNIRVISDSIIRVRPVGNSWCRVIIVTPPIVSIASCGRCAGIRPTLRFPIYSPTFGISIREI